VQEDFSRIQLLDIFLFAPSAIPAEQALPALVAVLPAFGHMQFASTLLGGCMRVSCELNPKIVTHTKSTYNV